MEIRTLAATSADGRALNQEVITDFSGKMAGVCYMKGSFDDLMREGSRAKVKEKGLLRSEGKEYVMNDGDVVEFLFNV